jgi:hypothetical protein
MDRSTNSLTITHEDKAPAGVDLITPNEDALLCPVGHLLDIEGVNPGPTSKHLEVIQGTMLTIESMIRRVVVQSCRRKPVEQEDRVLHGGHPVLLAKPSSQTQTPGHLKDSPIGALCTAILGRSIRPSGGDLDSLKRSPGFDLAPYKLRSAVAPDTTNPALASRHLLDQPLKLLPHIRLPTQEVDEPIAGRAIGTDHVIPLAPFGDGINLTEVSVPLLQGSPLDTAMNGLGKGSLLVLSDGAHPTHGAQPQPMRHPHIQMTSPADVLRTAMAQSPMPQDPRCYRIGPSGSLTFGIEPQLEEVVGERREGNDIITHSHGASRAGEGHSNAISCQAPD